MSKRARSHRAVCKSTAVALLLGSSLLACSAQEEGRPDELEQAKSSLARATTPSSAKVPALAAGNRQFGFDLFHAVAATPDNADKNLLLSPFSVSAALAMTYEGARGTTESEMKQTLHYELDKPQLHEAFNATDLALGARGEGRTGADGSPFRVRVSNSIWAQRDYPVVPAFLDTMAVHYGAGVFLSDFASDPEGSRSAINGWVSEQTEQLIPELLQQGSVVSATRFVLTNTVYFNAGWQDEFDPSQTRDGPFTKRDGSTVQVPTMHATRRVRFVDGQDFVAVALPYEDDALRFVAVLPDAGKLDSVQAALSESWFSALAAAWQDTSVVLGLPKLDYRLHTSLKQTLQTLGMRAAFGPADLSGLTSGDVYVDDVIHEAMIRTLEGGTIAAAATAVVIKERGAVIPEQTVELNRPFVFAIVDEPTGALLFLGRVLDPSAK
jgi:serpin B